MEVRESHEPATMSDYPVLQLTDATVVKNGVRILDG